ncbi:MAG: 4-alpha-glucanotransferase [Nitrospirae bacterium]|nr:4-alpha-glucanotransferase [Nitrospirota bacterium]
MKFGEITHFLTGVAIPVFSLKTADNCGIGEFLDLIKFGVWCKKVDIDIIQILPVNDTGGDSSPYNALSAFALHPVFIGLNRLNDGHLDWDDEFTTEIEETAALMNPLQKVSYPEINAFKLSMLKRIYLFNKDRLANNVDLSEWIESTPWLKTYCVYRVLKDLNSQCSWKDWQQMRDPSRQNIESFWHSHPDEVKFYAWVQFELESQLLLTCRSLTDLGLKLKGDIPIMINEDSADVWGERQNFKLDVRAGAPPDMFSEKGQNWGFPCYSWRTMAKDGYTWWKARLEQASKFYHAYRIDHVLGFFRIWQIPQKDNSGVLGHFDPAAHILKSDLIKAGFDERRIESLLEPVFTKSYLRSFFGNNSEYVINKYFLQTSDGNYNFSDSLSNERSIAALHEDQYLKDKLLELYWDRVLVESANKDEHYQPTWFHYKTRTYNNLHDEEKRKLKELVDGCWHVQDSVWKENGRNLLKMMADSTDMLVCAEDLGAVPPCVPLVLEDLGILGLRVERWSREYHKQFAPYIDTNDYPRLSVASPSVHDTSTLRGWWEELNWDRNQYYSLLKMTEPCPQYLTTELSAMVIKRNLGGNSLITIFPLQDYLSLYYNLRTAHPDEERVNVPGTISSKNWSYRMKDSVEFLMNYNEYNLYLKSLIDERRHRKLT